jgi:hypothetical protein
MLRTAQLKIGLKANEVQIATPGLKDTYLQVVPSIMHQCFFLDAFFDFFEQLPKSRDLMSG